jgi:hypothetical protein
VAKLLKAFLMNIVEERYTVRWAMIKILYISADGGA